MSDVEYSMEALNVLNQFHQCEYLVYVEGDDDILFWDFLFKYFGVLNFKIEKKDGSNELDKYTDRLIEEDLNIIVARDSDYKLITGKLPRHNRLITTYGYSIENTLYILDAVVEITKVWMKNIEFREEDFDEWINDFLNQLESLILFDMVNDFYELYIDVLGDNCTRYMRSQACANMDATKIKNHKEALISKFDPVYIENVSSIINGSDRDLSEIIRGHFLQSAILKFIGSCLKNKGMSSKVSNDALYTNAIQQLKICFNSGHKHFEHYKRVIESCHEQESLTIAST